MFQFVGQICPLLHLFPMATPSFIFGYKCFRQIWELGGYFPAEHFHVVHLPAFCNFFCHPSCLCYQLERRLGVLLVLSVCLLLKRKNTGCLKKLTFAKLSIWRSCCQLGRNTYDFQRKSANAQFGKTQFFLTPCTISQ